MTLVQTITGDPGVVLGQAQLPAVCTTFSGASLTMINGDQQRWTIICNLGMWTDSGSSKLFRINVPVISGGNGSNIHSVATVHANSGDMGSWLFSDRAEPATEITDDTIISTAFHYDLRKEAGTTTPGVFRTVNGETLRGTLLPYYISLSSPIRSNQAPVDDKFTFVDDVFFSADGNASQPSPLGDLEHYIMECVPNADSTGNLPRGYTSTSWANDRAVAQPYSGSSCVSTRLGDEKSAYKITLNNLKLNGPYPTNSAGGGKNFSNGPFFISVHKITVFVPDRAVDSIDDPIGNPTENTTRVYNRLADFSPVSKDGDDNFGSVNAEPGYCDSSDDPYTGVFLEGGCNVMPNSSASNNLTSGLARVTPKVRYPVTVTKWYRRGDYSKASGAIYGALLNGSTARNDGLGTISANQNLVSQVNFRLGGEYGYKNYGVCDVWDNSTAKLVTGNSQSTSGSTGGTPEYVYRIPSDPANQIVGGSDPAWTYLYGHYDTSTVDPLYNSALTGSTIDNPSWLPVDTYSTTDGRYWGNWESLKTAVNNCQGTAPSGGWHNDPNDVPGGIEEVNAVKMVPTDPSVLYTSGRAYWAMSIPVKTRKTFYGGPYDGEIIPKDTLIVNFTRGWGQREDDDSMEFTEMTYNPAPLAVRNYGDRAKFGAPELGLTLTASPTSVNAGSQAKWNWQGSGNAATEELENVTATMTIPLGGTYDVSCESQGAFAGWNSDPNAKTPIRSIDFLGRTVLTWNLGDKPEGLDTNWPQLSACIITDLLLADGTTLTASVILSADGTPSITKNATTTVRNTAELSIGKYVYAPDESTQNYTLKAKNQSSVTDFVTPKFIEVFPYNGDITTPNGGNRGAGSDFSGTLQLTTLPTALWSNQSGNFNGTFAYSADAPSTINQSWDDNTSTWCTFDGFLIWTRIAGSGACPLNLSEVTAFRFDGSDDLFNTTVDSAHQSQVEIHFTLTGAGFGVSDRYNDRFTLATPSITKVNGDMQPLISNMTKLNTLGFTVGNAVFWDKNNNGKWDRIDDESQTGVSGVTVQIWNAGLDQAIGGGDDTLVGTTTTNSSGRWSIDRVPAGFIYAVLPASNFAAGEFLEGAVPVAQGAAFEDDTVSQDGEQDGTRVVSPVRELKYTNDPVLGTIGNAPTGEWGQTAVETSDDFTDFTLDFGFKGQSSATGTIWLDSNRNGLWDSGEDPLPWANVFLTRTTSNGQTITITPTRVNGVWTAENLLAGDWRINVGEDGPNAPINTGDSDGKLTPGYTDINILPNTHRQNLDFGKAQKVNVNGYIWRDLNNDGYRNDSPQPDLVIPVHLLNSHGDVVNSTTVNPSISGFYSFEDLPEGDYQVVVPASEFETGAVFEGWNPSTPVTPVTGPSGSYVNNGVHQVGGAIGSNVFSVAYQIPGSYSPPTEYRASVGLRGTLGATASGYVWNDLNNDGVWDAGEPPLQNAYVRAVKVDPDQWGVSFDQKYTYTDANGYWEVETTPGVWSISSSPPSGSSLNQTSAPDLPIPSSGWGNSMVIGTDDVENLNFGYTAPAPISGRVWQDVNKDGIQDAGEDGIESAYVRVEGLDSNGNPITNWGTYTDANGDWSINWTFPGNYRVTVDEYYLEHYATPQGFDNPTWDVDGVATPFTATVTVPEGGLTGVDFGLSAVARVGNNVFLDFSHDGLFDDQTEHPTPWGLTVQLRNAADDSIVDTVKFDMMTGDYEYKFKVLNDGTYYIYIPYEGDNIPLLDMVELTTGSNPDPTDGVDNDNNGVQDGNAIRTGNFTVSYDAGVPPPNYTVDIGLYMSDEDRIGNSTIEKFTQTLSAPDAPGVPVKVGDPVKWTYKITNNGIFRLQFADFWDDMVGPLFDPITGDMNYAIEDQSAFDDGMWSQGESVTLSATGIAVEGPYQNTATAWVGTILAMTMDDFAYITDTSHYTGVTQGVEIVTELNGYDADPALGLLVPDNATLNWTFTVTNTGNFEDEFTVTNDQLDADDIVCDSSGSNVVTIGAGDSEVCRATTTSGIGAYTMNATASSDGITTYDVNGDPVAGTDYSAEDDGGYIGLESTISLVKKINGLTAPTAPGVDVAAGSTMNVSFEVTNTGNTALGNITIVDDTIASEDVNCPTTTLAPGASVTCTATLAAPPSGGTHVNNAEVQSTPIYDDSIPLIDIAPGNSPVVSDTATAHAAAVDLDIEVTKFIDGIHAPTAPGVLVGKPAMDLTFRVTNHSANTMTDVTLLDDDIPTLLISCPKSTLTAGESMDCASLTTLPAPTPGNPYSGDVTVTANTTLASGTVSVSDVDTAHAHAAEPAIGIQKFINGVSAPTTPGVQVPSMSTMNITYEVTNSGNTWLTGIAPVDDGGAAITCPSTLLAPSATMTCTASQPSPLATIVYSGQVTVEGTPSHSASLPIAGMDRVSSSDRGFAWSEAEAKVGVDTKINGKGGKVQVTPGSTMTVTHLVTNNGNSILTDVVLTNNGKPVKCPLTELKPGESMTCSEQVPAPPAGTAYVANAVVIGSPTAPNGTPIAGLGQVQDTSTAQASGISATNETTNRKPKDDRPNRLPNTGGPMIALLWLGAGLTLTGGVVLTGATRRRKKSV